MTGREIFGVLAAIGMGSLLYFWLTGPDCFGVGLRWMIIIGGAAGAYAGVMHEPEFDDDDDD